MDHWVSQGSGLQSYIDWLKSYYVVYSSAEAVAHGPANLGRDLLGAEAQRSAEHRLKSWTTR